MEVNRTAQTEERQAAQAIVGIRGGIKRKEPLYQLEENRSGNRPMIHKLLLSQDQAEYLANLKRVCSDYRHTIREPLLSQDQAREQ
ncbi:hypothetical protein LR48_Vigan293s001500 [Vigna angularis]|uniref:Uncharacterized protein n=1 Tax=Phaseolus angularis TaxID=3914 RepID=A0A0L9T8Z0_PHAAN|nr:hypothetical protein LR48_Vigan293s001500 [Vigna angularis]